ncbi:MAG: hypothetical protein WD049_02925 [Candidatus Paceibacterota bacterium]
MQTIQTILDTEQEAARRVEAARHARGQAIEHARGAGREEIDRYRDELAREREDALASVEKDTAAMAQKMTEEQKKEQATIEEVARAHHAQAVEQLLASITKSTT